MSGAGADLVRDLADAVEQRTATSEVLEAIGRSASELGPVFDTVLHHAVSLCGADAGLIYQLEGDVHRLAGALGGTEEYHRYLAEHPVRQEPGSLVALVWDQREAVQIHDAVEDPRYQWHEAQHLGGFRTMLGVPMLAADEVVGVIILWRTDVELFDERTLNLATTFAAQGAVAIRNVRLFRALQERTAELTRSVDELRALGEISEAVASGLDDDEDVLCTIVTRAAELTGAAGASIFELRPLERAFVLRACAGTEEELVAALRALQVPVDGSFLGRVAAADEPRQAPDLDREPPDPHLGLLRRHGWRSLAAVPLRREHEVVGVLLVRSRTTRRLKPRALELLETLASHAAVAIHNARAFRELAEKTAALEVAGRHKSEFLASMSHELRTPLNAVIGFSDVLLERMFGDLNERQEEYLRDIRGSGHHLLELINEILDLSKIEAGRMELELGAVDVEALLRESVAMVRDAAARGEVALALDVAPGTGAAEADELRLRQVVLNLLSNAIKFTPAGGSVTVAARLAADGAEVEVAVADTGVGIAAADRERIFDAFQGGGRAGRARVEGTGLGLTLSRRIVDLHGGRLWLASEVGTGSTFTFAVPRAVTAEPAAAPHHEAARDAVSIGAGTVLVVEDDRRSADLLRVFLEDAGYEVATAGDGVRALELARLLEPSAVILDLRLPRLSGWDVLARLKGDPATANIPVVIVSILDERGPGFALGAAEYLVKPVDRDALLRALGRCRTPPGCGRTVVVIDDDPVDLDLVDATLTPQGWAVVRARGGEEGVRLVRRERPSVVLLDLLMPDLDGFAVVDELRGDPEVADVPIVVLTAKDMTPDDHERLHGQISVLARKGSVGPAQLAELVRRLSAAEDAR